jgi:hypothetical protein
MPTLTATFFDRPAADRAVDELTTHGVPADDISVIVSNTTRQHYFPEDDGVTANVARGAASGGIVGGGLGAIAGGLLLGGLLTVATGGVAAPLLIVGPLAGALTGGVSGVALGSLFGGLVGAGISEPVAKELESNVSQGALVVAVRTSDDNAASVEGLLRRYNNRPAPEAPNAKG